MENTYKEWATEVLFLQSFTYDVNNSCIDNLKKVTLFTCRLVECNSNENRQCMKFNDSLLSELLGISMVIWLNGKKLQKN